MTALEAMQADVRRRGWDLVPLSVAPPASETTVSRIEARHGPTFPSQLRAVLTRQAARIGFGWSIPMLQTPFEGLNLPTSGGLRDVVWDLAHIDEQAIGHFRAMRSSLADRTESEELR